jgi:hypothetical protein
MVWGGGHKERTPRRKNSWLRHRPTYQFPASKPFSSAEMDFSEVNSLPDNIIYPELCLHLAMVLSNTGPKKDQLGTTARSVTHIPVADFEKSMDTPTAPPENLLSRNGRTV